LTHVVGIYLYDDVETLDFAGPWEAIPHLEAMFPEAEVRPGARWVDEEDVVMSAGISAGIDMSLHLIARMEGEELALKTARQMEFDWPRP
jgi:transcriptional regulator GlxA family with amidase domain